MTQEWDPQAELDRLRSLPLEERSTELEELIRRLEEELEEKAPRPPASP